MDDCRACESLPGQKVPKWKAPLLFVAAVVFCPCHLPATFAILATLGVGLTGASWLLLNKPLLYGLFTAVYLVVMVFLWRWFVRHRDQEREREEVHQTHAGQA